MATITFSHAVIWNGEIIPANTPIEVEEETNSEETENEDTKTEETEAPKKNTKKKAAE